MPEFLTKEKVAELLKDAPDNIRPSVFNMLASEYEIEGYNAEFSPLEMVENADNSLLEMGKAVWTAVSNPKQTLKGLSSLAIGAQRKLAEKITGEQISEKYSTGEGFTGSEQDEQMFDEMVGFFKERYGGGDRLLNTLEKDPWGFMADVAGLVHGGSGLLKKVTTKIPKIAEITAGLSKYGLIGGANKVRKIATRKINEAVGINKLLRSTSSRGMAKASGLERGTRLALKEKIGVKPDEFMARHGISGTLEDMHGQLGNIGDQTKSIVDNLLAKSDDVYKTNSANKILTELRNFFGKTVDDPVEGILSIKGKAFKQKEPVFVPMENMSQKFRESLGEIQGLLDKNKLEGLTLTELNKVKRLGDEVFDVFKRTGEVKAQRAAQNIGNLRTEIREFIETKAGTKGISDIKELNKQTQTANSIKGEIGKILGATETRTAFGDQIILLLGMSGSAASLNLLPIAGATAVTGGRAVVRMPRIRSFMATRLRLMTDGEYQTLLRGVESGQKTKGFWKIFKRERQLLYKAFPELRVAGIVSKRQEKISQGAEGEF